MRFIRKALDPVNAAPAADKIAPFENYQMKYLAPMTEDTSSKTYQTLAAKDIIKNDVCMFMNTNTRHRAAECKNQDDCIFWQVFDVFNKDTAKDYYKKFDGIPVELQSMVNDLF